MRNLGLSPPLLWPTTVNTRNQGVAAWHVSHLLLQLPHPETWAQESRQTCHNGKRPDGLSPSTDRMAGRRESSGSTEASQDLFQSSRRPVREP